MPIWVWFPNRWGSKARHSVEYLYCMVLYPDKLDSEPHALNKEIIAKPNDEQSVAMKGPNGRCSVTRSSYFRGDDKII